MSRTISFHLPNINIIDRALDKSKLSAEEKELIGLGIHRKINQLKIHNLAVSKANHKIKDIRSKIENELNSSTRNELKLRCKDIVANRRQELENKQRISIAIKRDLLSINPDKFKLVPQEAAEEFSKAIRGIEQESISEYLEETLELETVREEELSLEKDSLEKVSSDDELTEQKSELSPEESGRNQSFASPISELRTRFLGPKEQHSADSLFQPTPEIPTTRPVVTYDSITPSVGFTPGFQVGGILFPSLQSPRAISSDIRFGQIRPSTSTSVQPNPLTISPTSGPQLRTPFVPIQQHTQIQQPQVNPPQTNPTLINPQQLNQPILNPIMAVQLNNQDIDAIANRLKRDRQNYYLERFTGEADKVLPWLEDYNLYADQTGWTEAIKITKLPMYLKDYARDWFINNIQPRVNIAHDPITWTQIEERLKADFLPVSYRTHIRRQVYEKKQSPYEPVVKFIMNKQRDIKAMQPNAAEGLIVELIVEGLLPQIAKDIRMAKITTIQNLIAKSKQVHGGTEVAPILTEDPNETFSRALAMIAKTTDSSNYDNKFKTTEGRPECVVCDKIGHTAANCYTLQRIKREAKARGTPSSRGRGRPPQLNQRGWNPNFQRGPIYSNWQQPNPNNWQTPYPNNWQPSNQSNWQMQRRNNWPANYNSNWNRGNQPRNNPNSPPQYSPPEMKAIEQDRTQTTRLSQKTSNPNYPKKRVGAIDYHNEYEIEEEPTITCGTVCIIGNPIRGNKLKTIRIFIHDQPSLAMIDTGAVVSLITAQEAERLNLTIFGDPTEKLITSDGSRMNAIGYINLEMELRGRTETRTHKAKIIVTHKLPKPIVLGLDIIDEMQLGILGDALIFLPSIPKFMRNIHLDEMTIASVDTSILNTELINKTVNYATSSEFECNPIEIACNAKHREVTRSNFNLHHAMENANLHKVPKKWENCTTGELETPIETTHQSRFFDEEKNIINQMEPELTPSKDTPQTTSNACHVIHDATERNTDEAVLRYYIASTHDWNATRAIVIDVAANGNSMANTEVIDCGRKDKSNNIISMTTTSTPSTITKSDEEHVKTDRKYAETVLNPLASIRYNVYAANTCILPPDSIKLIKANHEKRRKDVRSIPIHNTQNESLMIPCGSIIAQYEEVDEKSYCTNPANNEMIPDQQDPINIEINNSNLEYLGESQLPGTEVLHTPIGKFTIGNNLSKNQKFQLEELLIEKQEAFSFTEKLGDCDVMEFQIELLDSKPIFINPYPLSPKQKAEEANQIEQMLRNGVIEPAMSPYSSPVVFVDKKDGGRRLCINYKKINAITKPLAYGMPRTDMCMKCLSGNQYFSILDLKSGYWNIIVHRNSREITAFNSVSGQYQFRKLPFGLRNAPAFFVMIMNKVLHGLLWNGVLVYLDDIVIYSDTFTGLLNNMRKVFDRLIQHQLVLKPSKCVLGSKQIEFVGYIIDTEGVRMNPKKIEVMKQLRPPRNVSEVRSVLGLFGFYRKFIEKYAHKTQPLTKLLRKEAIFEWTETEDEAYQKLKEEMTREPILAHYDENLLNEIRCDASGFGIAGILLQQHPDNTWRIIAYDKMQSYHGS